MILLTDTSNIVTWAINNGVAVVFCILLFLQVREMTKAHKDESDGFQKAIENNTIAITELMTFIKEAWK